MPKVVACAVVHDDPTTVFDLCTSADVELAAQELEFTPLFEG